MKKMNMPENNGLMLVCLLNGHFKIVKLLIKNNNCKMEEKNNSEENDFFSSIYDSSF